MVFDSFQNELLANINFSLKMRKWSPTQKSFLVGKEGALQRVVTCF
jgi:hypothetical protein